MALFAAVRRVERGQQVAYAATKAGVIQLSRVVAVQYASKGIRVNTVVPGQLHTPMVEARLAGQRADVVCLQEMKCQEADLDAKLHGLKLYQTCHAFAQKKGYSGVSLYSRGTPDEVRRGFASREFDAEGRYVEARFGKLSIVSLYAPSGSAGPERQASKDRFLAAFMPFMQKLMRSGRDYLVCGDWNIAHKEIDLRNWRANQKNSGFLPEEKYFHRFA